MQRPAVLRQINLIVSDMDATLAFYRRLGWAIETTPSGRHGSVDLPNGVRVEFDVPRSAATWDSAQAGRTGGSTVLGIAVDSRTAVDGLYADLVAAGHRGRQSPYDAFWGARYAIVEDPDGNPVGVMSPSEESRAFWPPVPPPRRSSE